MSYTLLVDLELTSKLGCARNSARLQSRQILQMGTYLWLTEAVKSTVVLARSQGKSNLWRTNPNAIVVKYLTMVKSALFRVTLASGLHM